MCARKSSSRNELIAAYAVPASKCEASIIETLLHGFNCGGVTFCQDFPPSRDVNQSIIGARPNGVRFLERRSDGVNDAAMLSFFRIARREDAEVCGSFIRFA